VATDQRIAELKRKALLSKGARNAEESPAPRKAQKTDERPTARSGGKHLRSAGPPSDQAAPFVVPPPTPSPSSTNGSAAPRRPSAASNEAAQFLLNIVNPPTSVPVKTDDSVAKAAARTPRPPPSVARHPDDRFVIHLDENTSDDSDADDSSEAAAAVVNNNRPPNSNELQRIKSSVEKLRQKIAAAEAANMNSAVAGGQDLFAVVRRLPPTDSADLKTPSPTDPVTAVAKPADAPAPPRPPPRPSALQMRTATIAKLKNQVESLTKRRRLLQSRLSVMETNAARLSQIISRTSTELAQAEGELDRQQKEVAMLTKALRGPAGDLPPSESRPSRGSAQIENKPVSPPADPIPAVVDSMRSILSGLAPDAAVDEAAPSSPIVRRFHYESPLEMQRATAVVDPHATLCQFALFGHCNDDTCEMLHLGAFTAPSPSPDAVSERPAVSGKTPTNLAASSSSAEFISLGESVPDQVAESPAAASLRYFMERTAPQMSDAADQ